MLGVGLAAIDVVVDRSIHLPAAWTYSASTASTVLSAVVGAIVGLAGFVVTVTVLIVQMATDSFSPRLVRVWLRDGMLKGLLALMVGAFAFSFGLLRRVESNFVPNLGVSIAGLLVLVSLLLFVVFLSTYLRQLRPVAVASLVAGYVRRDFRRLVAAVADAPDVFGGVFEPNGEQPTLVVRSRRVVTARWRGEGRSVGSAPQVGLRSSAPATVASVGCSGGRLAQRPCACAGRGAARRASTARRRRPARRRSTSACDRRRRRRS